MSNVHNRYVYDENIHVFVLDQTKTDDRLFKLTWRDTLKKLNNIIIVRLPDGMLDELKEAAKENKRSLNAEIIARLGLIPIARVTPTGWMRLERRSLSMM